MNPFFFFFLVYLYIIYIRFHFCSVEQHRINDIKKLLFRSHDKKIIILYAFFLLVSNFSLLSVNHPSLEYDGARQSSDFLQQEWRAVPERSTISTCKNGSLIDSNRWKNFRCSN